MCRIIELEKLYSGTYKIWIFRLRWDQKHRPQISLPRLLVIIFQLECDFAEEVRLTIQKADSWRASILEIRFLELTFHIEVAAATYVS